FRDDEKFNFEVLYQGSFVVVAGAKNPWARRRRITLAELMNEPWALIPPESTWGWAPTEAFRASGLDYPRATLFSDSPEVRMSLVATGRFSYDYVLLNVEISHQAPGAEGPAG